MSREGRKKAISMMDLRRFKIEKRKISMVTCYDAAFARIVSQSNVDAVLVGDSLGNVMMGLENTLEVSLDNMIHHSRSVASVLIGKHLCVDMPFGTYQVSATQAAENAIRLVQLGRAHSVKIEGGVEVAPQIAAISNAGIPVVAHLGLTPQSVHKLGGHRVQGRDDDGRKKLHEDALAVQEAGAQLLVLELVPAQLASELTDILNIPTVGIGAGVDCDGQVLVLQDLLGFDSGFTPKFLKRYLDMETLVTEALNEYDSEVKESVFPNKEQSY